MKKRSFFLLFIIILLVASGFLAYQYIAERNKLIAAEKTIALQNLNSGIVEFMKLFSEKVLNTQGEISFEDRLNLENSVRNLNDQDILNQWGKFVNSNDQTEAQNNVKNLLQLLINKINK